MRRLRRPLIAAVVWVACVVPGITQADMQEQLDDMFNVMTNYTGPTAFTGARRGVFSGGRLFWRNQIMDPALVTFRPPSFEAGCGGIDMFGGNFSYISADEFIELLRAIASNALGFAFKEAMKVMCPTCDQTITELQEIARELNGLMSGSCQMAQGLVTGGFNAMSTKLSTTAGNIATQAGGVVDAFAGLMPQDGTSPTENAAAGDPDTVASEIYGNIIWRALKESDVGSWFAAGGDDEILEVVMSMIGVVIVEPNPAAGAGESDLQYTTQPAIITGVDELMTGRSADGDAKFTRWSCVDDKHEPNECLELEEVTEAIDGLEQKVRDVLLGDATSAGLVAKFARNAGAMEADEQAFVEVAPTGIGAIIRNTAKYNEDFSSFVADQSAPIIAAQLLYSLMQDIFSSAHRALASGGDKDHAFHQEAVELVLDARTRAMEALRLKLRLHSAENSLLELYHTMVSVQQPIDYRNVTAMELGGEVNE